MHRTDLLGSFSFIIERNGKKVNVGDLHGGGRLPAWDVLEEAFRKLYGKAHPGPVSEKQDTLPPHGDFGLPVRRLFLTI